MAVVGVAVGVAAVAAASSPRAAAQKPASHPGIRREPGLRAAGRRQVDP